MVTIGAATAVLAASVGSAASASAVPAAKKIVKLSDKITPTGHPVAGGRAGFKLAAALPPRDKLTSYAISYGDHTKTVKGRNLPKTATHAFPKAGRYTVTLTVTDKHRKTAKAMTRVLIGARPTPAGGSATSGTNSPPNTTNPTPPGPVAAFVASATGPTSVHLSWTLPADANLTGITVRRATGTTPPVSNTSGTIVANLGSTATSLDDISLSAGTTYSYAAFAQNSAGLFSTAATATVAMPGMPDLTPPGPVTDLSATPTSSTVALSWTDPSDADLAGVAVVRADGDIPPAAATDGTLVIDDAATAATFTDTVLTEGATYSYALFAHDAAGNDAPAATVTLTLPDTSGDGSDGVAPLPTTVQPAATLLQSVTDNPDGSQTIVVGEPDAPQTQSASNARHATARVSGVARSNGVGAGGDPCAIYGITHANDTPKANAIITPAATTSKAPNGLLGQVTSATPNLSGTQCTVTSKNGATIDQAYSAFQHDDTSLPIKARYTGDIGSADKTKLPFGCTATSGKSFTTTADFRNTSLQFHTKLNAAHPSQSTMQFTLTAKPVFTISLAAQGDIKCTPDTKGAGLYIPIPGTPLIFELAPDATLEVKASATGTLTFSPTLVVSSSKGQSKLTAPRPTFTGTSTAELTANLDLTASLLAGGVAGISGSIGPSLDIPLSGPNAGCGTLTLDENLALTAHLLFTSWTYTLQSGSLARLAFGGCSVGGVAITKHTLASGNGTSCAIEVGGTVWCWGGGFYGELGNGTSGTNAFSSAAVRVGELADISSVTVGDRNVCALGKEGNVWCWGDNYFGELGTGSTDALSATPESVTGLEDVTSIAAGAEFACATESSGYVYCWGDNLSGNLGDGSHKGHSIPQKVSNISSATAVAVANQGEFACALLVDETVKCWGQDEDGELGDGKTDESTTPVSVSGVSGAIQIALGAAHACAVTYLGEMKCWGSDFFGQLGDNHQFTSSNTPVSPAIDDVTRIAVGDNVSCGVLSSGIIKCWGIDNTGVDGDGGINDAGCECRTTPTVVQGIPAASDASVGLGPFTCALLTTTTVDCLGAGAGGSGGAAGSGAPVAVQNLSDVLLPDA